MSSPLDFQTHSSGGAYGTHPSSNTSGSTRQRRNPSDYGIFSSPHGSFDDPGSFPPYAELPFTSLKRRRQLQNNNSFVKWAMRAVLLSPVVVVFLWSIYLVTFASNHKIGHSTKKANHNGNNQKQSQRNMRMTPNSFGNSKNSVAAAIPQQQLQYHQGNLIYNVNGNAMMMAPQQIQQQLQGMYNGQAVISNALNLNGYQQQQGAIPMQPQGNPIPVLNPLGNGLSSNVVPSNNYQQGQSQVFQQTSKEAGAFTVAQPQQVFQAPNGVLQMVQQQQIPQVNLDLSAASARKQVPMAQPDVSPKLQQPPLDGSGTNEIVENPLAMQQGDGSSGTTGGQLQASPAKQTVFFYDPNQTKMSLSGEILQMPELVYDSNGKAMPLEELRHQASIFVQAPGRGASSSDAINSDAAGVTGGDSSELLVSSPSRGASLVSPPAKEASIQIPQSWGTSTAQDQTIIIATVAVMALLVGALSARRLRSKSFLSSCIENETLEDDAAYDDAYTTTAAASGAMGADSSYNTFGGWKGDLEKFDV